MEGLHNIINGHDPGRGHGVLHFDEFDGVPPVTVDVGCEPGLGQLGYRLLILSAMFLVLIMLGMFMDQVSMMLITVPIFYPLAGSLGYDLIWFSLIVLMSLEMAATTPPFGLLLFIMLGMVKGTTLFEVAMAAIPFLFCDLILIIILVIVPGLGLWLPSLM